jgi:hypothetical protein
MTVSFRWAWREVRVEKAEVQAPFGRPWIGLIILKCEDVNGFHVALEGASGEIL